MSQIFDGHDLPVYYTSKDYNQSEQKKPVIEQELYGIYFAITQFRPYVYGIKFVVRTDHAKLKIKYYWKGMTKDIAAFIRNCKECSRNKVRIGTKEKLTLTPTPIRPFEVIVLDTIGPLPTSKYGNKYGLTLICDFTKYLVTIPIPDKSATTVAQAIFENFILIYGRMNSIKSDLGTEFKNNIFCELSKCLNIELNFSTAYHHQTVGTAERNHRVFNEYIRAYISENISDWDTYLRYFTFFHNTTSSSVFDNK